MPKVEYVEKTIFSLEGVNVDFIKDGKNVRDDASLPLQMQFPGYDFIVYDGEGNQVRGNMLLGNVRDTYLE